MIAAWLLGDATAGRPYDPDVPTYEELSELSRLPDPSTLLFSVRMGAPAQGEPGRREAVEHWMFHAGQVGYVVTPLNTRAGHGSVTWCGEVDVDGLTYQVHRGPRRRIMQQWMDNAGVWQAKFVLEDSIWAVPVSPEPEPVICPWCADGSPDSLRLAGSGPIDNLFAVWMGERVDGSGRGIVIQREPEGDEPITVSLEPAHATVEAGLDGWELSGDELTLHVTDTAAGELELPIVGGRLRFRLAVTPTQRRGLRTGLTKILGPSR